MFAALCIFDIWFTKAGIEAGWHEMNIASGMQVGFLFFVFLKIIEMLIVGFAMWYVDWIVDDSPIHAGAIIGSGACTAQVAGMAGTIVYAEGLVI
jgi:hypothetical protein